MRTRTMLATGVAMITLFGFATSTAVADSGGTLPATPTFQVTTHLTSGAQLAPGLTFIDPHQTVDDVVTGPEIINDRGQVVWYYPLPAGSSASNFQVQEFHGRPVLTFWEGTGDNPAFGAFAPGIGQGEDVIMNDHYQIIDTYSGDANFTPDTHEFQLTPQGDALISGYREVPDVDLTSVGGPADGTVIDSIAREVNLRTGKVIMDWSALAHVPITDSYALPLFGTSPWDFFHINSISQAPGGNLLISARHMWALYDVNPRSGSIVWTLGGKQSSFALGAGAQFAWQHDPRFVSRDEIQLFDDEAGIPFAPAGTQSRAIWLRLDYHKATATLTRQILQPAGQAETSSQGSVQTLRDGNVMVGWGSTGTFSEYDRHGDLLQTDTPSPPIGTVTINGVTLPNAWSTYRVFKERWYGMPTTRPVVSVSPTSADNWTVSAAWNGATEVSRWLVLAGPSPKHLRAATFGRWNGLITPISLSGANVADVQVVALGRNGRPLGESAVVPVSS